MRRLGIVVAGLIAVLALAPTAAAITYGQRDGTGHPNVGAMMAYFPSDPGTLQELCTGTLVAPKVFLTAAHCTDYLLTDLGITDVWVTFNTDSAQGPYMHGVMHQDAAYPGPTSDPHDIAVIVLDEAPQGIVPATLPTLGLFDAMKKAGTLNAQRFTAVGYGDQTRVHATTGAPAFGFDGYRWVATSGFNALNGAWLRLSQNPSTGNGGTCFGDSGGPNFLGDTQVIAATTITGDSVCRSTNVDYRLDTAEARAFLAAWGVPLP